MTDATASRSLEERIQRIETGLLPETHLRSETPQKHALADLHLTVATNGDDLTLQPTGQTAFALYQESERKFFARVVDAEIAFVRSEEGTVTGLTFKQNGKEMSAKRAEGD